MLALTAGVTGAWVAGMAAREYWASRKRNMVAQRVLVGGVRGKTSLAHLIHEGLRVRGINAVCRTTGDNAQMTFADGSTMPVFRPAVANIREMRRDLFIAPDRGAWAAIFENMAVDPELMTVVARHLFKPTVAVFAANSRDHIDFLPTDPRDRAELLLSRIDPRTPCVVPASDPTWVQAATRLRREVIPAKPLADERILRPYMADLAGVALAALRIIDREAAEPAPLVPLAARMEKIAVADHLGSYWIDLLSVNDPESTDRLIRMVMGEQAAPSHSMTFIYQHIAKRPERLEDFLGLLARGNSVITGDPLPTTEAKRLRIPWVPPEAIVAGEWKPGAGRMVFLVGNAGSHGRALRAWHRSLEGQATW